MVVIVVVVEVMVVVVVVVVHSGGGSGNVFSQFPKITGAKVLTREPFCDASLDFRLSQTLVLHSLGVPSDFLPPGYKAEYSMMRPPFVTFT